MGTGNTAAGVWIWEYSCWSVDMRVQLLECGSESTADGVWIRKYSSWSVDLIVQLLECGSESTAPGMRIWEYNSWSVDLRVQLLDCRFESTAAGLWIWEYSYWSVDLRVQLLECGSECAFSIDSHVTWCYVKQKKPLAFVSRHGKQRNAQWKRKFALCFTKYRACRHMAYWRHTSIHS